MSGISLLLHCNFPVTDAELSSSSSFIPKCFIRLRTLSSRAASYKIRKVAQVLGTIDIKDFVLFGFALNDLIVLYPCLTCANYSFL